MTGDESTKSPYTTPAGAGSSPEPPLGGAVMSTIRYRIVAVSVLMAFSLYLDRVCLGEIVKSNLVQ